jgi:DNA-binding MarR family transcriptional regulator
VKAKNSMRAAKPENAARASVQRLSAKELSCYQGIELVFFGHMSLTRRADALLEQAGYGRAHFRALYVIARNPGVTANGILARLKIANQSLARVMKQLLDDGMVLQENGSTDRRQRKHSLTAAGVALEQAVLAIQFEDLRRAYSAAGPAAVEGFLRVLLELLPEEDRALLSVPVVASSAAR